jgi:hypothetical protein
MLPLEARQLENLPPAQCLVMVHERDHVNDGFDWYIRVESHTSTLAPSVECTMGRIRGNLTSIRSDLRANLRGNTQSGANLT